MAIRIFAQRARAALALSGLWALGSSALSAQQPTPDAGHRFQLPADSLISGVRCGPTGRAYAVVHPNGALDECPLARDTTIAGHRLPAGTWIRLLPDGSLDGAWLPFDVPLQGLPCKGSGYKGWAVRFHPSGALKLCYLARDATIGGLRCRRGAFLTELSGSTAVTLASDGRLLRCRAR